MNQKSPIPRCPELMSRADTSLLLIDVQDKLVRLIHDYSRVLWNCGRLIDAAHLLGMPVLATEQYPQGLGPTVDELSRRLEDVVAKTMFSCRGAEGLFETLQQGETRKVILAGIEAHVCVQQTAFDLLAEGFSVYLAADAISSRHQHDREFAFRRMESAGAVLTTTEAAIFEWCEDSNDQAFKQISQLIRQSPPE